MRRTSLFLIARVGMACGVALFTSHAALANRPTLPADECLPDPNGPPLKRSVFPRESESPYILPFEPGKSFLVWRTTSHFNPGNKGVGLYAIDFEMPIGTPLIAARGGKVVAVQQSFRDGNDKDLEENFVMIEHDDKTIARYIHISAAVRSLPTAISCNKGSASRTVAILVKPAVRIFTSMCSYVGLICRRITTYCLVDRLCQ
jgi:hypothetical protein